MQAAHWRYLLLDNGAGAAFINVVINGAIAWAIFHGAPTVPLWGPVGIAADTAATSLILPFLTCLIVTALTGWHVRAGRQVSLAPAAPLFTDAWPRALMARATVLAMVSLVLMVPVTLFAFVGLGIDRLPFQRFLAFKVVFAVADGLWVTPLVALLALTSASKLPAV
jgi:hypothetical protein